MTSETPLRLRVSPSAPTRKDVHECDQGDDHHRSDSDDGNGGCGDDHARIVSGNLFLKTTNPTIASHVAMRLQRFARPS